MGASLHTLWHENSESPKRAAWSACVLEWEDMEAWHTVHLQPRAVPQTHRAAKPPLVLCWYIMRMTNNLCCYKPLRFRLLPQHHCSKTSFCRVWEHPEHIKNILWWNASGPSPDITWQYFPSGSMFLCLQCTRFLLPGMPLAAYQIICTPKLHHTVSFAMSLPVPPPALAHEPMNTNLYPVLSV